jgi:formylglycine-generating enzyme required for sulfatase activity
MAFMPAGSFWMGCDATEPDCDFGSKPKHYVTLSPYYMGRYEVTAGQYATCVAAGKCSAPDPALSVNDQNCNYAVAGRELYPMNCVTWAQAATYCVQMLPGGHLPTEAQWERSARGDCATLTDCKFPPFWPWGANKGNCGVQFWGESCANGGLNTAPVGSYPSGASAFYGLHDILGNVAEWVADNFSQDYYAVSPTKDPTGPASGFGPTVRGFPPNQYSSVYNAAYRQSNSLPTSILGFRCARGYP